MKVETIKGEGGHEMAGVTHGIYTQDTGLNINSSGQRRATSCSYTAC